MELGTTGWLMAFLLAGFGSLLVVAYYSKPPVLPFSDKAVALCGVGMLVGGYAILIADSLW